MILTQKTEIPIKSTYETECFECSYHMKIILIYDKLRNKRNITTSFHRKPTDHQQNLNRRVSIGGIACKHLLTHQKMF